ncbi:HEPN/Toprim-associated domain-containing protein [Raoultella ornithinolytica]|uniref:HEPN/Toprim-associated domain-containing protein n=1 Tax=Raoultella ornithinolytica TaxID=54291 RepID=UPI000E57D676|nr:HEPN/Toprim-associated domain-containing protein [Raoultella ornithinolytica]
MSSCAEIKIDGFVIDEFTHHGCHYWYFKNSERVRDVTETASEEDSDEVSCFIGYRTNAKSIRKRLELSGFSRQTLEQDFETSLENFIDELERGLGALHDNLSDGRSASMYLEIIDTQNHIIQAIRGTSLDEWLELLPVARKEYVRRQGDLAFSNGAPKWVICDSAPALLNAMLSTPMIYSDNYLSADFNFPASNPDFFSLALLMTVQDDAVCELNLTELVRAGYLDDFTDLAEIALSETSPCKACRESLAELELLAGVDLSNPTLLRMCYASMITSMETYIGDIIKREIMTRPALKERFVASYEEYSEMKFPLSQIHVQLRKLENRVRDTLDGIAFHNLGKAKEIFRNVLLVEFDINIFGKLCKAVGTRNDIVHRNGKDKKGNAVSVNINDIQALREMIVVFISNIDMQVLDGLAAACLED